VGVRYSPHIVVFVFGQHVLPIYQIIAPVLSSLAITFFLQTNSLAARPVFCSPTHPLDSLGFNSQLRRRFRQLASFVVASRV
jgi:hypothetical protein